MGQAKRGKQAAGAGGQDRAWGMRGLLLVNCGALAGLALGVCFAMLALTQLSNYH